MTTFLKSRTDIMWVLFLGICLLSGIFHGYYTTKIISPSSQYFVTVQYDILGNIDKASNVIKQKNMFETQNNVSVYRSDCNAIHFKKFNYVVLKHKDVSLCNVANVPSDEFVSRTQIFKDKVDGLWISFYLKHATTIIYGLLKGALMWLAVYAIASVLHGKKRRNSHPYSTN